jgi:N-acylneuraminate cytidylyltransferase
VGPNTIGLETDELGVQDIDTEQDWQLAELKYRLLKDSGR